MSLNTKLLSCTVGYSPNQGCQLNGLFSRADLSKLIVTEYKGTKITIAFYNCGCLECFACILH